MPINRGNAINKSTKLALKVHLKETFGDNAITAVRRGLSMAIALYALCAFFINIFVAPYDSFASAIFLLFVAYGLGGSEPSYD